MNQLEPCPHCLRHVRVSETSCPFCAHALAFADLAPRRAPRIRLGRAATFAFSVLASSQAACTENGRSPPDAAVPADAVIDEPVTIDADDDGGVPIYAAAPTRDAAPTRG